MTRLGNCLYISDLDGTLLNGNKEVSQYSRETLNTLLEEGVSFSVATARTALTTLNILAGLQINMPIVLMNGAVLYDIANGRHIKAEIIPASAAKAIISILEKHNMTGFMYIIANDRLVACYENLNTAALQNYHDERVTKYGKTFRKLERFANIAATSQIIYFTLMGEKQRLVEMAQDLKELQAIDFSLSSDVYDTELWYLEIHSCHASKYNAVTFLRDYGGFSRVVGFGDNFNDIPLLRACDEFYAVGNAVDELKVQATGIIADHCADGVSRFIAEREQVVGKNGSITFKM